ncbi:precorrin-6y C5,15-methyltransferase (decarboxylating) subunit CbiE [Shewanella sp. TC10]|uniref:precorrin-6y C5,15-methyltransferase (decarboxylating) subunit CbiE n=1 Tax=Shewanella sp. TC10 TaxID=1419739 RepID=UPI00129EF143|nr:precorrin-6y C5,15-methyltransferase (decarboxylating) subunit CbiE [Shewanella sp. TC10]
MTGHVSLIGMAGEGCLSLTSRAINAVSSAEVLVGSASHLAFFPQFTGKKLTYQFPIEGFITELLSLYAQQDIAILTSGDPLFYGLGQTLAKLKVSQHIEIIPHLSCVQQACARLGLPYQDMALLSLHGKVNKQKLPGLVAQIQHHDRFALLTDATDNPLTIACKLVKFNELGWQLHLCEALGTCNEKITHWTPIELAKVDLSQIHHTNIIIGERTTQRPWENGKGHQPDSTYSKRTPNKGLITKAPIRAIAVANLQLTPKSVVWDIGAGSGSVGIEAAKQAYQAHCYAIECNDTCWPQIEANIINNKVDNLQLIKAKAPQGLAELPSPDAIFCGGSRGQMSQLLPLFWQKLTPGGRLICSAVTLDTVIELKQLSDSLALTPQLLLVSSASDRTIGSYTSYQSDNPIHLFIFEKAIATC